MKISDWINSNIKNQGAQKFFDSVSNDWYYISDRVKNIILDDIYTHIKPSKIETIDDLARLLNNNHNGNELDNPYNIDVEQICRDNKWVILFPYSDDNLEIRGYIRDELGAFDGGEYKFVKKGEFYQDPDDDEIYRKAKNNELIYSEDDPHIFMKWCVDSCKPYIWYIDTDYTDVSYFDIIDEDCEDDYEDGEIWARCCVIDLSSFFES